MSASLETGFSTSRHGERREQYSLKFIYDARRELFLMDEGGVRKVQRRVGEGSSSEIDE